MITDVHFLSNELSDESPLFKGMIEDGDGKNLLIQDEILRGLLSEIERKRPAALLITGDITFNGEKKSHRKFARILKSIESMGTEVYVIPGNHDLLNPWARTFKGGVVSGTATISPDEFRSIYRKFGYDKALSRDKETLSYLIEPLPGLQVLMLNSCIYANNLVYGIPQPGGRITPSTKKWITESIAGSAEKKIVAALHHSVLEHNRVVSDGYTIEESTEVADFFTELGITSFLTGHIHIQDIVNVEKSNGAVLRDISTNALSVYPHNYGIIWHAENGWHYRAESLVQGGPFDEDFRNSAEDFFIGSSNRLIWKFLGDGNYTEEELNAMSTLFARANLNFFSGNESLNSTEIRAEDLELFYKEDNGFLSSYLESILEDHGPGDQETSL
ncbi:MAG: metallophosphoesterase [Spirochaetales bacterium]|nr:metallophosphoesterase [Spirochaetales bacterium]